MDVPLLLLVVAMSVIILAGIIVTAWLWCNQRRVERQREDLARFSLLLLLAVWYRFWR
jgi:membrane-anchored protein YejM (alkaline phosphatase superfamily)